MQLVAAQDVLLGRRGGQHDDRDVAQVRVGLDLLQQLPAVVLRQVQVEQDQVGPRGVLEGAALVEEVQALLAVVGDVQVVLDLVVLEGFPGDQLVARVVLDEQDVDRLDRLVS